MTKCKTRSLKFLDISIKKYLQYSIMYLFKTDISVYNVRHHVQSKIVYQYYSKMRSLKTV